MIKPLILLISSADPQLQEYSVTTILNLSLCDQNKEFIASSGAIKPLVRALRLGTHGLIYGLWLELYLIKTFLFGCSKNVEKKSEFGFRLEFEKTY